MLLLLLGLASARAVPDAGTVAVLMADTREPDLRRWLEEHKRNELGLDEQARLVTMLTAYLNGKWACQHGYELLFYRLLRGGCAHPVWGERHPSYCKLTAIGEALSAGYGWVVYLDSDAFVHPSRAPRREERPERGASAGGGVRERADEGERRAVGVEGELALHPVAAVPAPAPPQDMRPTCGHGIYMVMV